MIPEKSDLPEVARSIRKSITGIRGLDEITNGGLPSGRTVLISGGPGCGKTLLGMEFLYRGATEQDEPGVFVSFEESPGELVKNVRSFGWDLDALIEEQRLFFEHIQVESEEILETGAYDLDALFIRLMNAVQTVGARRIVLDTVESLFSSLPNEAVLRSELRRLFRWLKSQGLTALITGERGEKTLTRYGLEEYVSDCVIELTHRTDEEVCTRRLQVLKYRGSSHETNKFPFLIDENGFSVIPITSVGLAHEASEEHVSTGIEGLDGMLDGKGFFRGSSVLVNGMAGTGKTTMAAHFAEACCVRGERCLYISFEESGKQILRNMGSIGRELQPHLDSGHLRMLSERPTKYGLESHLLRLFQQVDSFQPQAVLIDPISSLTRNGQETEVQSILVRFIDFLKIQGITCLCTNLMNGSGEQALESTSMGISSIMDTLLLLRNIETRGELKRTLFFIKARGMKHSNQVREFHISDEGIKLVDFLSDS